MPLPWHDGFNAGRWAFALFCAFPWLILRNEEEKERNPILSSRIHRMGGGDQQRLILFGSGGFFPPVFFNCQNPVVVPVWFPVCYHVPARMLLAHRKTAAIRLCFWVWRIIRLVSQRHREFLTNKTKLVEKKKSLKRSRVNETVHLLFAQHLHRVIQFFHEKVTYKLGISIYYCVDFNGSLYSEILARYSEWYYNESRSSSVQRKLMFFFSLFKNRK